MAPTLAEVVSRCLPKNRLRHCEGAIATAAIS